MTVHLEIPDDLLDFLVPQGRDAARAILEDAVAEAYREGRLTMHLVGKLLDLWDPGEVNEFLGARKICDDYSLEDFDRDAEMLRQLRANTSKAA